MATAFDTDGIRRGTRIGRYEWSLFCRAPGETLFWLGPSTLGGRTDLTRRTRDALRAEGVATLDADERRTARVRLSGRLKSVDVTLCRVSSILAEAPKSVSGHGRVEIEWTAIPVSGDTPPLVTVTSGEATLIDGVPEGGSVIFESAVIEAARSLARSETFLSATKVAPPPPPPGAEIDRAAGAPGVGAEIVVETGGKRIPGTVAGHSRRPDTGAPVILLDLSGRPSPRGATVRDSAGRAVARSLGDGSRWNQAAWIGLVPAEIARDDSIDPARPDPKYQPEPDEPQFETSDPNGPDR